ncbi:MAG: protein kinase [Deltaproteobacteria bacterium]|nr:protein kinase [Deltaproteobacteria bacterium]
MADFVAGRASPAIAAAMALHLDTCAACRARIAAAARDSLASTGARVPLADAETLDSGGNTLPTGDVPIPRTADELPTVSRGHYEVLSEHARGGLGRILRARDLRTGRLVAIKEMLAGTPGATARFVREALVTANLQHPAIVPVYELGRWPEGEPFYAMKLVAGGSLDAAIRDAPTLRDRLALLPRLIDVADAIAYAHGEGVIHRDLKPANVLVGNFGETIVIDWGLARRAGDVEIAAPAAVALDATAIHTLAGDVLGTPVYMPPEQARGEAVDARADVYALGAMLYHLLSGQVPYAGAKSGAEVLALLLEQPPRPLAELEPATPPDLLAIVTKAMAPRRDDRYASARELAEDLRRFQTGQLVGAHAYSASQLVRRWIARHRGMVGVAAVLVTLLAITAVVAVRGITAERNVAERERGEADALRIEAVRQRGLVEARNNELIIAQARSYVDRDPTRTLAWLKQLPPGAPEWAMVRTIAGDAREQGVARWVLRGHTGHVLDVEFTPDDRGVVSAGDDGTIRIWDLATGTARVLTSPEPVTEVLLTPDGARAVGIGPWDPDAPRGRAIRVWDLAAGTSREVPDAPDRNDAAILSPDGRTLALITCPGDVSVVALDTLARRALLSAPQGVERSHVCASAMAFSPDGRLLAAEGGSRVASWVSVLRTDDGQVVRTLELPDGANPRQIVFSTDGARVLTLTRDGITSWGVASGDRVTVTPPERTVRFFTAIGDSGGMLTAGTDRTIRVWSPGASAGRVLTSVDDDLSALLLAPDHQRLVAAGDDRVVRVLNLTGTASRMLRGHDAGVTDLALSHDGAWIASASDDGTVRIWSLDGARRYLDAFGSRRDAADGLALAPDDRSVVLATRAGCVERWDLDRALTELRGCDAPTDATIPLATTRDRRVVAVGRVGPGVDVWTGGAHASLPGPPTVASLALTDDGARLFVVEHTGAVHLIEVATGRDRVLAKPVLPEVWSRALALADDGSRVAWAEQDGALGVYDLARDLTRTLPGTGGEVRRVVLTPDGATAISTNDNGDVARWDLASGAVTTLRRGGARAPLARSPDGARVASADPTFAIHVTEIATGRDRVLTGHGAEVVSLAFSPDGRTLASASDDDTTRLWDLATDQQRTVVHHDDVGAVVFTADSARIATATWGGTLSIIQDDLPRDEAGLRAFLAAATNLVVGPNAP